MIKRKAIVLQEEVEKDFQWLNQMNQEDNNDQIVLRAVIVFAGNELEGIKDDEDKPIILRYLNLMNQLSKYNDIDLAILAILHGVSIHHTLSREGMSIMGVSDDICNNLYLLSNPDNISFRDYLQSLSISKQAMLVKLEDLKMELDFANMMHDHINIEMSNIGISILNAKLLKMARSGD